MNLTEDQFINQYQPQSYEYGDYVQYAWGDADWPLVQRMAAAHRVWTMLDVDGKQILSNGCHFVNRMYYILCDVPYDPDAQIDVDLQDFTFCPDCDHIIDSDSGSCSNCEGTA